MRPHSEPRARNLDRIITICGNGAGATIVSVNLAERNFVLQYMVMAGQSFFNPEEAEEILRQAVRSDADGQFSRDDLVRTAGELGISAEAVEAAIERLHASRRDQAHAESDAALRKQWLEDRRRKYLESVGGMLSVAVMLVGINFLTSGPKFSGMFSWSIWPAGIFAVLIVAETIEQLFKPPTTTEFEKWKDKRSRKRATQSE
jgi:hypothetical protein